MDAREVQALLHENPVATQIAIKTPIAENIERVIDVLESPARFAMRCRRCLKMRC